MTETCLGWMGDTRTARPGGVVGSTRMSCWKFGSMVRINGLFLGLSPLPVIVEMKV